MRTLVLAALLCACDSTPTVMDMPVDAPTADTTVDHDAPFVCMTAERLVTAPAGVCLALEPRQLTGATPFGNVDLALDYFAAGDCIDHALATVHWTGACGEGMSLQFPYPVTSDGSGRRSVTGNFDVDARFEFQAPGWAPRDQVTTVHVDVSRWQEGQGVHDIDITVTVTDPRYALAPWTVRGTFCDWPYYIC